MTTTFVIATRSEAKVRELMPIIRETGYDAVSLCELHILEHPLEEGIEQFETFEENALAKARWFSRLSKGLPVLADDSGLEVDALGGRPGVRSKRWSGRHDLTGVALDAANNERLVDSLQGVSSHAPFAARYVCAAACVWSGGEVVVRGATAGSVVLQPNGNGGFGYDPYFLSAELDRTFGQATLDDKSRISHRGRAFRLVFDALAAHANFPGRQG